MKKIISVFLIAVIFIISVFSLNAFAQEHTKTEKWYETMSLANEYEVLMRTRADNIQSDAHCFYKNGNTAVITEFPVTADKNVRIKVIVKDGYIYLTFPSLPFLYFKYDIEKISVSDILSENVLYEDMTLISEGETDEFGTPYYLEEYVAEDNTSLKYYFEGDKLCFLIVSGTDEEGNQFEYTANFVYREVDDSVFEIPWYSINIAPIVPLLSDIFA